MKTTCELLLVLVLSGTILGRILVETNTEDRETDSSNQALANEDSSQNIDIKEALEETTQTTGGIISLGPQ